MAVVSLFNFHCSPWRTTPKSGQEHPIPKMPHGNSKKKRCHTFERDQEISWKLSQGKLKLEKRASHNNRQPWWCAILRGIGSGPATASKRFVNKGHKPKNMSDAGRTFWPVIYATKWSNEETQRLHFFVTSELELSFLRRGNVETAGWSVAILL